MILCDFLLVKWQNSCDILSSYTGTVKNWWWEHINKNLKRGLSCINSTLPYQKKLHRVVTSGATTKLSIPMERNRFVLLPLPKLFFCISPCYECVNESIWDPKFFSRIPNPGVLCSKPLGSSKVDSAFHLSEVNKMSTRNWSKSSFKMS